MNPTLTPYELLAMMGLTAYLCAPALKKLFGPEIERLRGFVSAKRDDAGKEHQKETDDAVYDLQEEVSPLERPIVPTSNDLRIALTRSCADALLATLQGDMDGNPKRSIDSKLREALSPGCRTIKIEVDDSPLFGESTSEMNASGQQMFVVRNAAAGEVRVSSPWEYMSEPGGSPTRKAPATIWSAHSNFLGLRNSIQTESSAPAIKASHTDEAWVPKQLVRGA